MQGYITGGWNFVIAAYSLSGTLLAGYLISVVLRLRAESKLASVVRREEGRETSARSMQHATGVTS